MTRASAEWDHIFILNFEIDHHGFFALVIFIYFQ